MITMELFYLALTAGLASILWVRRVWRRYCGSLRL